MRLQNSASATHRALRRSWPPSTPSLSTNHHPQLSCQSFRAAGCGKRWWMLSSSRETRAPRSVVLAASDMHRLQNSGQRASPNWPLELSLTPQTHRSRDWLENEVGLGQYCSYPVSAHLDPLHLPPAISDPTVCDRSRAHCAASNQPP